MEKKKSYAAQMEAIKSTVDAYLMEYFYHGKNAYETARRRVTVRLNAISQGEFVYYSDDYDTLWTKWTTEAAMQ